MRKLHFIVNAYPHESCIVNRQIGVGEFKYGITSEPHLQVVKVSRDLLFKFWDPLQSPPCLGNGWS